MLAPFGWNTLKPSPVMQIKALAFCEVSAWFRERSRGHYSSACDLWVRSNYTIQVPDHIHRHGSIHVVFARDGNVETSSFFLAVFFGVAFFAAVMCLCSSLLAVATLL